MIVVVGVHAVDAFDFKNDLLIAERCLREDGQDEFKGLPWLEKLSFHRKSVLLNQSIVEHVIHADQDHIHIH